MPSKYYFSQSSLSKLEMCTEFLQEVALESLRRSKLDFGISWGHRGKDAQMSVFRSGHSRVEWPNSKHNTVPSKAFDFFYVKDGVANYTDPLAYAYIAGVMDAVAAELGGKLRWGGNWDSDNHLDDQDFMDYGHIEEQE